MNADESAASGDEFRLRLAACDDALAAGASPPTGPDAELPSTARVQLEQGIACMQLLRQLLPAPGGAEPSAVTVGGGAQTAPAALPTHLGRYQIRCELGRGGFGIVFLAYDPQLHREVALKVPRPDALVSAELRERFQQEARAAAGLDHPNLVPLYEAGEIGPICYIASAYCPGVTLAAWLRQCTEPIPLRVAARLVACLAAAVQHAHSRGVLHRDLKPSNVLLSRHSPQASTLALVKVTPADDLGFVPRVMDFGLAKVLPALAPALSEMEPASPPTQSGAILGTPSYMAPEQAEGKSSMAGPATDVYGLGTILYEMLTGRPPFQGETALDTLQQVRDTEPVAPSRLRPKVPRDLETICLKCLRKEPAKRYPTPRALADDVHRFLAQEPIRARPTPFWERALKWSQRRPATAAALGLLALLVVALALSTGIILRQRNQTEQARLQAQANAEAAQQQKQRAESNLRKARTAVDKMLTRVGAEHLRNLPQMEKLRRDFLQDALELNQEFLQENSRDPGVRNEVGQAYRRVGIIRELLGELEPAEEAYRQAFTRTKELAAEYPDVSDYRENEAEALLRLGLLLRELGRLDEAEQIEREHVGVREQLVADYPADPKYRHGLASARHNLSRLLANTGRQADAEAGYEQARVVWEQLVAEFPQVADYRSTLSTALNSLGLVRGATGRPKEAEEAFQRALVLREQLVADHPAEVEYQQLLARLTDNFAWLYFPMQRHAEAEPILRRALPIHEQLVAAFPNAPEYRQGLGRARQNLAIALAGMGRLDEAQTLGRGAVAVFQKLAAEGGTAPEYQAELATCNTTLGGVLQLSGRFEEAAKAYRQALAAWENVAALSPQLPDYPSRIGDTCHNLAELLRTRGDLAEARRLAEQAVGSQKAALSKNPKHPVYREHLAGHLRLLVTISTQQGDQAAAARVAAELDQLAVEPPAAASSPTPETPR